MDLKEILALAKRVRIHVVEMAARGKTSHVASGLSIVDVLCVLYGQVMKYRPSDPNWSGRDRFILSKGHAGAALYAVLAEVGFFPISWLERHGQDSSPLSGHVSHLNVPGVELSTGSLGHGLGVAAGMAISDKIAGNSRRVFCVMSDGECQEGSVWEAALFASHHQLANLCLVIDYNKLQSLGTVKETLGIEPLQMKWESFGWKVVVTNGHDCEDLISGFTVALESDLKPSVIIANTIKGKGVSFMENSVLWHYRSPNNEELINAINELSNHAG